MKTSHSLLLIAALSPAAILLSGCAKADAVQQAAQTTKAAAKDIVADVKTAAVDSWDSIKDYTYQKRNDFADTLNRMASKYDADIREMNAKVKDLPEAAAEERDRALKEFNEANIYLKSLLMDLRTGTADTWDNAKKKVAEAWEHVQAAYEKVKARPTS